MSPSVPHISAQLRQLIYYHLDNDLVQNALFFAGRLHGLDHRNPDAAHLLALCNLKLGRLKAAHDYSRDKAVRGVHLGCAYVFAQACLGLGEYANGISALERARGLWSGRSHWNKHFETSRRHVPDAAAVNCLLGKLARANSDPNKATNYYVEALKLNPFMWDAFTDLCDMGAKLRTPNIFKMTPEMMAFLSHSNTLAREPPPSPPQHPSDTTQPHILTPSNDPFNAPIRTEPEGGLKVGGSSLFSKLNSGLPLPNGQHVHSQSSAETPTSSNINDDDVMMGDMNGGLQNQEPPHAPVRKTKLMQSFTSDKGVEAPKMRSITSRGKLKGQSESQDSVEETKRPAASNHKRTVSGHASQASTSSSQADPTAAPQRRSVRLFNQIRPSSTRSAPAPTPAGGEVETAEKRELRKVKATGTKGRSANPSTVGRVVSGNRNLRDFSSRDLKERPTSALSTNSSITAVSQKPQPGAEIAREQEALQCLLDLLKKLGEGYYQLSRYQCQSALQIFRSVTSSQRETPWVLAQMGKAHYESASYTEAEEIFRTIKKIAPSRMEDTELYSTVLWHLKSEMDLAYLSHELIESDRLSPQAWCSLGNSFSLQREHDQAIKCFRRATQLDPKFAYAFTLMGHEHVANEEFDKALHSYRCAVGVDQRHYNGWYGMGRVHEQMGKYPEAEKYYRAASSINPSNSVLIIRIGTVLEKQKKTSAALVHFSHACDIDPRSLQSRFKKARALMNLRRPREALVELETLKDIAPDEANVHFMLGRLYKMMRDKGSAIRHFTVALNLDPKAAQLIKEAMESLEDDEEYGSDDD